MMKPLLHEGIECIGLYFEIKVWPKSAQGNFPVNNQLSKSNVL